MFLSMASLVIGMQLRNIVHELQRRVTRYKNYKRVVKHMQEKYENFTSIHFPPPPSPLFLTHLPFIILTEHRPSDELFIF